MKHFLSVLLLFCLSAHAVGSYVSSGGAGVNCASGTNGQVYTTNGSSCSFTTASGTGTVTGPVSSTAGAIATWHDTGGVAQDDNSGATIASGKLTIANILDNGLTASRAVASDASKNLVSSATTATELGYLSGVTSAIQTQLGTKAPLDSPTFTTTTIFGYGTASTVPYWDSGKNLISSSVTPTELGYVHNVTSAIQTQFNAKAASGANADVTSMTGVTTSISSPTFIDHLQITTPSTPAASHNRLYFKSGDHLWMKNSAGTETQVDGGGSSFTASSIEVNTPSGVGSGTSCKYLVFTHQKDTTGSCITWGQDSVNGDTFTIGAGCAGGYAVQFYFGYSNGGNSRFGIAKNPSDISTFIGSLAEANKFCITSVGGAANAFPCIKIKPLADGDVLKANVSTALTSMTSDDVSFTVTRVY